MPLSDEIEAQRQSIRTDGYPMSIGELASLYMSEEIEIHPEFQRFYRWTSAQKSRLIESLLLGIPLPSIFVSQRQDGVWEVIDGLQRLSTIFQLMGILRTETGDRMEPLTLEATKYLPSLAGKRWEDAGSPESAFGNEEQLLIKRSKIDVKIILRESTEATKYELFDRVNTGGTPLSTAEVRSCLLIMVNRDFYTWFAGLGQDEGFIRCIALTDRAREERYDLELVSRFLTFRRRPAYELRSIGDDLGAFVTDTTIGMAQAEDFDRATEEDAFRTTFAALAEALDDRSFRRYDVQTQRFLGGFLISAFEAIALGIGFNAQANEAGLPPPDEITDRVKRMWSNPAFTRAIGSGIAASSRIPATVPLGRNLFSP